MRGSVYTHNKKMKSWAKNTSEKVTNVFLGLLLIASPVIGVISPKIAHAATVGDVVITEFIADPDGTDTVREWIEIQNQSDPGIAIDITGWNIDGDTISGSLNLLPGEKAVVCRSSDTSVNDGVICDATSGFSLSNSGDSISLRDDTNAIIDSVVYADSDVDAGHSTNVSGGLSIENTYRYSTNNFGTPANNTPLDDFDPIVTPIQVLSNHYINTHTGFKTFATDTGLGNTGIDSVTVHVHGINGDTGTLPMGGPNGSGEYGVSVNTFNLDDGVYQADFTATDNAGNSTTTTETNITIDNTTPLADISTPSDNDTISGTVDISGSGSDLNIRGYRIRVYEAGNVGDGTHVAHFGQVEVAGTSFGGILDSWDTTLLPDGDYVLQLSVRDGPWNTGFDHVPVTIDNVLDQAEQAPPNARIRGKKFNDLNANGQRNASEPLMNNWAMNLYDDEWNYLETALTGVSAASTGTYRFEGLDWGTYYVCEVMQDGWIQTRPFDGSDRSVVNLSGDASEGAYCLRATMSYGPTTPGNDTDNEREINMDFGNSATPAEIRVHKVIDLNKNGEPNFVDGEIHQAGWTMRLYEGNGSWAPVDAGAGGANGNELVTNGLVFAASSKFVVQPGSYYVCEAQQDGYEQSFAVTITSWVTWDDNSVVNGSGEADEAERCISVANIGPSEVKSLIFGNQESEEVIDEEVTPPGPDDETPDVDNPDNNTDNNDDDGTGGGGPVVATFAAAPVGGGDGTGVLGDDTDAADNDTEDTENNTDSSNTGFGGGEVLAETTEGEQSWWGDWWKWLLLLIPLLLLLFFILARRRKDEEDETK